MTILIPDRSVRIVGFAASVAMALSVASAVAQPDAGSLQEAGRSDALAPHATLTCERAAVPGRVRCEVEARVDPGTTISWGDFVLRRIPPLAIALRGRVGPHDASVREPGLWRWAFALVAREKGAGEVEGQVRVVVCKDKACLARDLSVVGKVEVGP